jgi:hypothetical protein
MARWNESGYVFVGAPFAGFGTLRSFKSACFSFGLLVSTHRIAMSILPKYESTPGSALLQLDAAIGRGDFPFLLI